VILAATRRKRLETVRQPRALPLDRSDTGIFNQCCVPALVIEGEKTNVPLDATEGWARWLPFARLLLIANAGHMNWLDQPDVVSSSSVNSSMDDE
jgi:pimeloyl-ACP methyl ester carboxylesterase